MINLQVHYIEQRTDEWRLLRAGRPTASNFSSLVTPTGKLSTQIHGFADKLANEVFLSDPEPDGFTGNVWTDRGAELEVQARGWYEFETDLKVTPCGFITNFTEEWEAGCSPDGLVGDDGMVEIKALKADNHTSALREIHATGSSPRDYKAQTQGQILIAERKWCDLIFYHPTLPSVIVRQLPDADFLAALEQQLKAVCAERDATLKILEAMSIQPRILEKAA